MKKVLLIDYAKYTGPDGQATYNYKLIQIFRQLGWNVTHFSFGVNNHLPDTNSKFTDVNEIVSDYYDHHKLKSLSITRLLKVQKYGMKQLVGHLKHNEYDLIIDSAQFTWKFAKCIPSENRIWIQHQCCSVLDYSQVFGKFWCKFFYWLAKHVGRYYANIETTHNAVLYTKYDLEKINKVFNNQIYKSWTIPLSCQINREFKPLAYNDRKRAILFVGRLDLHQKHINFLIRVSKYLNLDIHVYGDGDLLYKIKKNPNRIKYMGVFDREQVSNIYSQYLFTILVSKFEGFSFALVESLCNGTPIITVDSFDSAHFLVNNGANGLLLNHKDSAITIANKINIYIEKITNNQEYDSLVNNAHKFSQNILDDKFFIKDWTSLINEWGK